jgi:uncharacterized protein with HEPN domain
LEAIRKIKKYLDGISEAQFISDEKTIDAVIRNFSVIGEEDGPNIGTRF